MRKNRSKTIIALSLIGGMFTLLFSGTAYIPKMQTVHLVDGITVLLPKEFVIMSDDDLATRYPSTKKPVAFYTSLDRTVDFGLNISKSRWSGVDMELLHKVYKSTILESYEKVEFLKDTVEMINNRPYSVFEFLSTFDKTRKYQYLQFTLLAKTKLEAQEENGGLMPGNSNHILIFNLTAPIDQKDTWAPIANASMHSVRINANKASKSIPQVTQPEVKGLSPKSVLEHQKKKSNANRTK